MQKLEDMLRDTETVQAVAHQVLVHHEAADDVPHDVQHLRHDARAEVRALNHVHELAHVLEDGNHVGLVQVVDKRAQELEAPHPDLHRHVVRDNFVEAKGKDGLAAPVRQGHAVVGRQAVQRVEDLGALEGQQAARQHAHELGCEVVGDAGGALAHQEQDDVVVDAGEGAFAEAVELDEYLFFS